jgi:hypothetical protein
MALLDRSAAVAVVATAALSSPRVRESLREGAVRGLAYSMVAADSAVKAGRGAWRGAREGFEASRSDHGGSGRRGAAKGGDRERTGREA